MRGQKYFGAFIAASSLVIASSIAVLIGLSTPVWATATESIASAGFEDNSFTGWDRGSQTGTLGASITSSGTGVSIFSGSRTFTHGSRGAVGNPTLGDGSPNPYYAPAVESGSWTFSPNNNSYAALLQPKSEQTFSQAMAALGLSGAPQTAIQNLLIADSQASGYGDPNPTDAAWITKEVELTAGVTYTMSWNYVGTDYVPYNDGSLTSLVPVTVESEPEITVNNYTEKYALLGFTNPGTGDYSVNSFGATGWQTSTYEVSVTGTYKLGFAAFNLGDTGLSPVLMIDNEQGITESCTSSGTCTTFGGVQPNNDTAPSVETTTTTTVPTPTSLVVTSLEDTESSGTLRWAITQANTQSGGIYDSITFSENGTITLSSALPQITESVTITGNGRTNTIIDGNNLYRIFSVTSGRTLTVSDMTLKQGQQVNGGLIYNAQGTVSATNIRFTSMGGGSAVFNYNGGSTATYTNCTFDYLSTGISADHGSTPALTSGYTSWNAVDSETSQTVAPDSLFSNRTYVDNCVFDNNGAGINSQRFTKISDSTFTNNSYGAAVQGLNRTQIIDSTFEDNGIGIYHNSWIPVGWNMGVDNRLITGNTFTSNGISIYLDDTWNNGQKNQSWSTITGNSWDANGVWVRYYQWDGTSNAIGTARPYTTGTVFAQSTNTFPDTIGAPSNLTATDTGTSVVLSWSAPSTGGYLPERYAISFTTEGQNGWGIATGNVGDANALNTTITIDYSLFESLMPSGTTWSFSIRSDNDTFGKYSASSNVVSLQVGVSPSTTIVETTTTSSSTTTTTNAPVVTQPQLVVTQPEPIYVAPTTTEPTTEETPQEEVNEPVATTTPPNEESEDANTEDSIIDTPDTTEPTEPQPSGEDEPDNGEIPQESTDEVQEPADEATAEEVIPEEVVEAILGADLTEEQIVEVLSEELADLPVEEALAVVETLIEELVGEKSVDELTDEDKETIAAVVAAIIQNDIDQTIATALASDPAVLASVSTEQAKQIFQSIDEGELTDDQGAEIVAAIQDAPDEVKETFEESINIFAGAFDTYVPLGSTISVATRRTVIAVAALAQVATVGAAVTSSSSGNIGSRSSDSSKNNVARREEEEEEAGEIESPDLRDWLDTISIWVYVNGIRKFSMKKFLTKFWYETLALGFTMSSSIVLWVTLSGFTRNVAVIATLLAFAAHYYLVMWKKDGDE